jgi:hypothetical protein
MARPCVAIIGRAPTATQAPYDDADWEKWGLAWGRYPGHVDLLFDIHARGFKDGLEYPGPNYQRDQDYFDRVDATGRPVMCGEHAIGDGPLTFRNGIPYPLEAVSADLPVAYLECTISYMLGLAIHRGVDRIGLWGCNFRTRPEFMWQLPSVTWLIGLAQGRGIEVDIAPGSTLMTSGYVEGRYGITREERWTGVFKREGK